MGRENRIEILDGLRVIAIAMVMLYHFYPMYDGVHYNYSFEYPEIFGLGNLGVQLFFVISGFVITLTLTKCKTFSEFIMKRFIRLIPGMLICSSLTFFVFLLFDSKSVMPASSSIPNWLLSNTFISPELFNTIFQTKLSYVDRAYWSLFVEIQFYVIAGIFYFMSAKHFLRNFAIFCFISLGLFCIFCTNQGEIHFANIIGSRTFSSIRSFVYVFLVIKYSLWFLAGVIVNKLYYGVRSIRLTMLLVFTLCCQAILLAREGAYPAVFTAIILIIFLLFINKPNTLAFLANKSLARVGLASYSIYLIHQNIGVLIITKTHLIFGAFEWLPPLLLVVLSCIFGLISYKYLENPFSGNLKRLIFKKSSKIVRV